MYPLIYRLLDLSRLIATVDADSLTGKYGWYWRPSMPIRPQRIMINRWSSIKYLNNFVIDSIDDTCEQVTPRSNIQLVRKLYLFIFIYVGSLAVDSDGILHTPPYPRCLGPSSPSFPFRRSDSPPFFTPERFDDGILPTPHFSTRLPFPSSLRRSGSFPRRSGPPKKASSTPVSRLTPSTFGAHPIWFSVLPSPQLPPSSPQQFPVLASLPFPSPLLLRLSLPALLAFYSLLIHLCQVAQCAVPCPFLTNITCHYVFLCRSFIPLPPPSLLFPSATMESTWDPGVFTIIIINFSYWWLSYNKQATSIKILSFPLRDKMGSASDQILLWLEACHDAKTIMEGKNATLVAAKPSSKFAHPLTMWETHGTAVRHSDGTLQKEKISVPFLFMGESPVCLLPHNSYHCLHSVRIYEAMHKAPPPPLFCANINHTRMRVCSCIWHQTPSHSPSTTLPGPCSIRKD